MQPQHCKTQLQHITSKSSLSSRKFTETQIQQNNATATLQNSIATHHFKTTTLAEEIYRDARPTTQFNCNITKRNCNTSLQDHHSRVENLQRRKSDNKMQEEHCKLQLQHVTSKWPLWCRKFTETQIQQTNATAILQNAIATGHFKMTSLEQEIYSDANPTKKCNRNIASCNCNTSLQNHHSRPGNLQRRKSNKTMQLQHCKTQLQHITSKSPLSPRKFTETQIQQHNAIATSVSYTHLTLPTKA